MKLSLFFLSQPQGERKTKKKKTSLPNLISPIQRLVPQVGGDLRLPPVPVVQQLLLVVQQLLPRLGTELKVGTLDDRIHRARLLAKATVDAFRHVDVVPCGATGAVFSLLGLDGDCLRRADGLAELAGDASLFACRVAAQGVFPSEAW